MESRKVLRNEHHFLLGFESRSEHSYGAEKEITFSVFISFLKQNPCCVPHIHTWFFARKDQKSGISVIVDLAIKRRLCYEMRPLSLGDLEEDHYNGAAM